MYVQTGVERDELRWAERRLCKLSKNIPYKRVYEDEADRIAMQLMTRACFDVRKAKRFWEKRCHLQVNNDKPIDDQFIGVHQGFGVDRVKEVESLIPPFIELRKQCNCPPLN